MNLLSTVRDWFAPEADQRSFLQDLHDFFVFDGNAYPITTMKQISGDEFITGENFEEFVHGLYRRNGIVFAMMATRLAVFSQARFKFRQRFEGRSGQLFGTEALDLLENPWPQADTGLLLSRMINDHDLVGNAYITKRDTLQGPRLRRARPDWTSTLIGFPDEVGLDEIDEAVDDIDADVVSHFYHPGGFRSGRRPKMMLPEDTAHFTTNPDPLNPWRGQSWLLPIVREAQADNLATIHKSQFFKNAASPNLVVRLDISDPDDFKTWVEMFNKEHKGALNAYKTLFFGAGAETTVVGNSFREMDYKRTMGVGETRIAAAAGLSAVVARISEGNQGAGLNLGNYGAARRMDADTTFRFLWQRATASLRHLVDVPSGAELWYDETDIPFLQEDEKDEAEIRQADAATIRQLVDGGYEPASVVEAVKANDMSLLVHSGLVSVQLRPPGTDLSQEPDDD